MVQAYAVCLKVCLEKLIIKLLKWYWIKNMTGYTWYKLEVSAAQVLNDFVVWFHFCLIMSYRKRVFDKMLYLF